jgi:hypothetical protein
MAIGMLQAAELFSCAVILVKVFSKATISVKMPHPNLRMLLKHEKENACHEKGKSNHLDLRNPSGLYHYLKTEFYLRPDQWKPLLY